MTDDRHMASFVGLPQPGALLRALVTAGGYRPFLEEIGRDKDLDDLAKGKRLPAGLLGDIEKIVCQQALIQDCGPDWTRFFQQFWRQAYQVMQALAQTIDTCFLVPEVSSALLREHVTAPMLAGFIQEAARSRQGPDWVQWWACPLSAWLGWAARRVQIEEIELQDRFFNALKSDPLDLRTRRRWLEGEPMGVLSWPYRTLLDKVFAGFSLDESTRYLLTGWLLLACACQSLPQVTREAIQHDIRQRQQIWEPIHAVKAFKKQASLCESADAPLYDEVRLLIDRIKAALFGIDRRDDAGISGQLSQLQTLLMKIPAARRGTYPCIYAWFSARHAALKEKADTGTALRLYKDAVSLVWWRAGQLQHCVLREALVYAVGVGDKNAANRYWDKVFMLGLNAGPKRPLDRQERRRLAFGFEQEFKLLAKDRIPPPVEIHGPQDTFVLKPEYLRDPNRKIAIKQAQGRTRRTPLMMAVMEGTLEDVMQLIEAGGDPNDGMPESGVGPLIYAMRRACDRKDSIIMQYLLRLALDKKVVNRAAGTGRETPLKLAVEMADDHAVRRLLELGADAEAPCDGLPSVLCYAMVRLHESLHPDELREKIKHYLAGYGPADVHDAKDGAVLDAELANRRLPLAGSLNTPQGKRIFNAVLNASMCPPDACRAVVLALLEGGADANCRYYASLSDLDEWTPTLFAAQTGDVQTFLALLKHGGDPSLTLRPGGVLDRYDALWIAGAYQRDAIVDLLRHQHDV